MKVYILVPRRTEIPIPSGLYWRHGVWQGCGIIRSQSPFKLLFWNKIKFYWEGANIYCLVSEQRHYCTYRCKTVVRQTCRNNRTCHRSIRRVGCNRWPRIRTRIRICGSTAPHQRSRSISRPSTRYSWPQWLLRAYLQSTVYNIILFRVKLYDRWVRTRIGTG